MIQQNFKTRLLVRATPRQAMEAISHVSSWWAADTKGPTRHPNDQFTVRFGKTYAEYRVTEWIPDTKIVWLVTHSFLPLFKDPGQWNNTQIVWELAIDNGETEITMTHRGLTPELECFSDCKKGWTFYIKESLRKLISEGEGYPGTGIFGNISNGNRKYEGLIYFRNDPPPDYPDGFIFIDVKETSGETVVASHSVAPYQKEKFNPDDLKGEYFMIIENKPAYDNISPLTDIQQTIYQTNKISNMKQDNYNCTFIVKNKPEEVADAVSRVREWWTKNIDGNTAKKGDLFTVQFGQTWVNFEITEVVPHQKIVWLVTDCFLHWLNNKKEWKGTEVEFEISTVKEGTQVSMTHVGLVPQAECFENCKTGWNFFAGESLLKLITEKTGKPDTPVPLR